VAAAGEVRATALEADAWRTEALAATLLANALRET
jgi:hypothetical protein